MILGPERLPVALKNILSFQKESNDLSIKSKPTLRKKVNINEITQEIHNEQILKELGEPVEQLKKNTADIEKFLKNKYNALYIIHLK